MKQKIKIIVLSVFLVGGALFFTRSGEMQTKQVETAGQKFKNIKVLNDMPADQMGKVMNLMSASLNVNCNFCHIENDFAKDGKEEKESARQMITMTLALNKNYFDGRPEISCNTCHNGKTHPQNVPNLSAVSAATEERPKQPATKPTIDAILDKYTLALGGKENLAKITSRVVTANRVEPNGKTETEEITQKGNKILIVTRYPQAVVSEAFDGASAWKRANADEIKLKTDEAEQIKRNAQFFAFNDLKTVYSKLDFRFVDKIDGRDVYLVTATTAENQRERLYFDAASGLLVRRISSVPTVLGIFQYQVDYMDYKDFGGVKLPATVRYASPNINWTRKITDVKNNAVIDDMKFVK